MYSFAWIDDTLASPDAFLSFLDVLRGLPLRAITLRTTSDLGEDAWALLNSFTSLQKVAIWCMNGPPRVLQGWAPLLGNTLTELELGVRIHFVRDPHHGMFYKELNSYNVALRWCSCNNPDRRTLATSTPT